MNILHSCQDLEADHGGAEDAEAVDIQAE